MVAIKLDKKKYAAFIPHRWNVKIIRKNSLPLFFPGSFLSLSLSFVLSLSLSLSSLLVSSCSWLKMPFHQKSIGAFSNFEPPKPEDTCEQILWSECENLRTHILFRAHISSALQQQHCFMSHFILSLRFFGVPSNPLWPFFCSHSNCDAIISKCITRPLEIPIITHNCNSKPLHNCLFFCVCWPLVAFFKNENMRKLPAISYAVEIGCCKLD